MKFDTEYSSSRLRYSLPSVRQRPSQTAAVAALIPYAVAGKIKGSCVPMILTIGKF